MTGGTVAGHVGFVGAGVMGLPMAHHLLRQGHELTVHARAYDPEAGLAARVGAAIKEVT